MGMLLIPIVYKKTTACGFALALRRQMFWRIGASAKPKRLD